MSSPKQSIHACSFPSCRYPLQKHCIAHNRLAPTLPSIIVFNLHPPLSPRTASLSLSSSTHSPRPYGPFAKPISQPSFRSASHTLESAPHRSRATFPAPLGQHSAPKPAPAAAPTHSTRGALSGSVTHKHHSLTTAAHYDVLHELYSPLPSTSPPPLLRPASTSCDHRFSHPVFSSTSLRCPAPSRYPIDFLLPHSRVPLRNYSPPAPYVTSYPVETPPLATQSRDLHDSLECSVPVGPATRCHRTGPMPSIACEWEVRTLCLGCFGFRLFPALRWM